jgi:cytochrome c
MRPIRNSLRPLHRQFGGFPLAGVENEHRLRLDKTAISIASLIEIPKAMLRFVIPALLGLTFTLTGTLTGSGYAMADGSAENGKALFSQCDACHEIGAKARNRTGPILNNIVGRDAATRTGYVYSRGMRNAASEGLVWTEETLDGYIANPRGYVRGNRMAYAGMRDKASRADLIAFLRTLKFAEPIEERSYR